MAITVQENKKKKMKRQEKIAEIKLMISYLNLQQKGQEIFTLL